MDINIPGLKPIWIISFKNSDPKVTSARSFNLSYCSQNQCVKAAQECLEQAEKIREELVNLRDVVEQFRDFLKRFKKEI